MSQLQEIKDSIIKFAGDSGDGMQLTGTEFTNNTALLSLDIATFPDFPAEIRAPQGTIAGVSGFQVHFSSNKIFTPGDKYDVLVAMNAAAFKANFKLVEKGGIIIVNEDGFDNKNLRLANYPEDKNPIDNVDTSTYKVIRINITKLTREALQVYKLTTKEKDRAGNMFVLGILYWMYNRDIGSTINHLKSKFSRKNELFESNYKTLQAGYDYAETTEIFSNKYQLPKAKLEPGLYRTVTGSSALAFGLVTAAKKANMNLFLGSYPITPASDILHELSKLKSFGVKTFQAEDEIASISSAIGASYGGDIGITSTSGPGMSLKTEAIGLAVMLEIPLLVINIQRAGPATGMPTKTEQADLLQAYYGRNGECPLPVIAASAPSDCFFTAIEGIRIALEHCTPVILLSDGYIANGAEVWKIPNVDTDVPKINFSFKTKLNEDEEKYLPYKRNEKLVRQLVKPGTPNMEHRIGGIEKQDLTGNISYDPENHQKMVLLRQQKIDLIEQYIPEQKIVFGKPSGDVLIVGWGSTYGIICEVTKDLIEKGHKVSNIHIKYLRPFPKNLKHILENFKKIVVPEINNGQLIKILKEKFLIDAIGYNKIKGSPITHQELLDFMANVLKH